MTDAIINEFRPSTFSLFIYHPSTHTQKKNLAENSEFSDRQSLIWFLDRTSKEGELEKERQACGEKTERTEKDK